MAYSELLISALKGTLEEIESNPSVSQRDGVWCLSEAHGAEGAK